jgi:hypothetical protein
MRMSGQCQDYAIAKFLALRALGFADTQLRLVALRDTRREIDHAVLVVALGACCSTIYSTAWCRHPASRTTAPITR